MPQLMRFLQSWDKGSGPAAGGGDTDLPECAGAARAGGWWGTSGSTNAMGITPIVTQPDGLAR